MSTPDIEFWYGSEQSFGQLGNPQRWVNILGTASHAEGLASLSYSLNGGAERALTVGPDGLRVRGRGDFNAEIDRTSLSGGTNVVRVRAIACDGHETVREVNVHYVPGRTWPLPYAVHWGRVNFIMDAVQVVDGRWRLTPEGIRPLYPAYDRLVAIGDVTWTDYQVTVPAAIHGFVDGRGGLMGGFGLLFRWTGHYADEHQPSREWRPSGAIGWYRARWEDSPARSRCLNISDGVVKDIALVETPPRDLHLDARYVFQFSVRSRSGRTSRYRYRA